MFFNIIQYIYYIKIKLNIYINWGNSGKNKIYYKGEKKIYYKSGIFFIWKMENVENCGKCGKLWKI